MKPRELNKAIKVVIPRNSDSTFIDLGDTEDKVFFFEFFFIDVLFNKNKSSMVILKDVSSTTKL